MKNKIIINSVALAGILALGACATGRQTAFVDDVYQSDGKARQVSYRSPDYYADTQPVDDGQYTADQYADSVGGDADTVYDTVYNDVNAQAENPDAGYYDDEYSDSEYANRINRFYYSSPGMSYYDPWFDPWYGYAPGFSFGIGWGGGWGWGSGFSLGWGSSFYNPYYAGAWGWGNPYYGSGFWGPYSYYGGIGAGWGGYYGGYYGGGYYGHRYARPQRTRGAYETRSRVAGVRSSGGGGSYVSTGRTRSSITRSAGVRSGGTTTSGARNRSSIGRTGVNGTVSGRPARRETVYITRDQNGRTISTTRSAAGRPSGMRPGTSSRNYGGENRVYRPSANSRPGSESRPSYSRPESSRSRPEASRPSYTPPARSGGESMRGGGGGVVRSSGGGGGGRSSGGGGGGGRSSRGR